MRRASTDALQISLGEFAFLLLFLALGACAFLYTSLEAERRAAAELRAEVDFLNEQLAEKKYGVVPCWKRPDKTVPALIGRITIRPDRSVVLSRTKNGQEETLVEAQDGAGDEALDAAVRRIFSEELAYAAKRNCYVRLAITNETDSFAVYRRVADTVRRSRIVVASE